MIREQLKEKSIAALRSGDKQTRSQLIGILARFLDEEKSANFKGFTEQSERALVSSYVKMLKGGLEQLSEGELADSYRVEISLLEPYLPQLLDEAATRELVTPLAEAAHNLGMFMGSVMKTHKGKVDPALVRRIGGELGLS
jgi:uncharacterized protein YqeY